jgi:hypothetical protein
MKLLPYNCKDGTTHGAHIQHVPGKVNFQVALQKHAACLQDRCLHGNKENKTNPTSCAYGSGTRDDIYSLLLVQRIHRYN